MSELGQHLRIRLASDRLLHSSPRQRRSLARAVHKTAAPWPYLGFGCAGVHLHLVMRGDHRAAGELARRLEISLQRRYSYGTPFLRVHRRPLEDQHHAFSSVLYDMRQREHHDLASDPYLEATSAPDLLGVRVLGAHLIPRAIELLPELRRHHLLKLYGIDDLQPAAECDDPAELVQAALAAFAIANMGGLAVDVRRARHVVVWLIGHSVSARELAPFVGSSARTVERIRQGPAPDPVLVRTVRLQLDLQRRVKAKEQVGLLG